MSQVAFGRCTAEYGGQQMQCSPKVKQVIEMIFSLDNEEQEEFAQIIMQVIHEELRGHRSATIN